MLAGYVYQDGVGIVVGFSIFIKFSINPVTDIPFWQMWTAVKAQAFAALQAPKW